MEAKEESKKPKVEPVPSQSKAKVTKSSSSLMKPSSGQSSYRKGVLKQKDKSKRTYVATSLVAFETESDEEEKQAKKKGEFVRVVRKPQSGGALQSKKAKFEPTPTRRCKRGRKLITKLDKDLESGHVQAYYENLLEVDQRKVEGAIVLHLRNFSKSLIELEHSIPKDLYNILDARRLIPNKIDKEMKERELINVCTCIFQEEAHKLIKEENKKEFRSRNRVNRLMIGSVEEVRKETKEIWRRIIKNNPLYSDAVQTSHSKVRAGVPNAQKDKTRTEIRLIDQSNVTLDVKISENPLVEGSIEEVPEVPKDDTAPSGDIGAQEKGDDVKKEEPKKIDVEDRGVEVDKGKRNADTSTIDTQKDKEKKFLPQKSINLDGPLDIGQMYPAEKMMVVLRAQLFTRHGAGAPPSSHCPATAAGGNHRPRPGSHRRVAGTACRLRTARAQPAPRPRTAAAPAPPQRRQPPALAPGHPADQGLIFF
ncbi:uncharacterized protein LOC131876304 [Cryptomeria japonica]|uniref:uncharacterized protein LOC131876304 n=1 Tax=Cryptomeria japonica TaxID=3369 RepID=UPI0027DA8835|nr:uncharacterized protein LOC131876304 [Cryptomeria japonica]